MRDTRVKDTKLRTVHYRWWRSRQFWTYALMVLMVVLGLAIGVALAILGGPNGGAGA
jgi:hypothetical protein